jgi:hypothetical protein
MEALRVYIFKHSSEGLGTQKQFILISLDISKKEGWLSYKKLPPKVLIPLVIRLQYPNNNRKKFLSSFLISTLRPYF